MAWKNSRRRDDVGLRHEAVERAQLERRGEAPALAEDHEDLAHVRDVSAIGEAGRDDDVIDAAQVRRGATTANNIWGNHAVILVGDFLLSKALSLAVTTDRLKILKVLAQATTQMAEGELLQLIHAGNLNLNEAEYFEVITRKTAILMSAACQIGGILAGETGASRSLSGAYCTNIDRMCFPGGAIESSTLVGMVHSRMGACDGRPYFESS